MPPAATPHEAIAETVIVGKVGRQQLQRDAASEAQVIRLIDDAHTAAAYESLDSVGGNLRPDSTVERHPPLYWSRAPSLDR
jgi:hypothetical protein